MSKPRKRIRAKARGSAVEHCRCTHVCEGRVVYVPYPLTTTPYIPSYPSWWWQTPQIPQWTIVSNGTSSTIPNTTVWNG